MLTPLAAGNGGYFPPAWGWSAAALLWAAAIALLVRQDVETSVAEVVTVSAFGLLTVWMLISATWSGDTTSAVLEAERTLVYVAGLAALLLVSRRGAIGSLLAGALFAVAVATAYGLVGRLFPSVHAVGGIADTGRLAEPVGYWNGLGILAAMGAIIAIGLAAHARTVPGRIVAIATLPVVVSALYFTYSRGALDRVCVRAGRRDRARPQALVPACNHPRRRAAAHARRARGGHLAGPDACRLARRPSGVRGPPAARS